MYLPLIFLGYKFSLRIRVIEFIVHFSRRPSLLLLLVFTAGCGDAIVERVPVAGKVTIDNRPLTSGTIRFVPKEGRPASSKIGEDGGFELAAESVDRLKEEGVPRGNYRVQVSSPKIIDDRTIHWNAPAKYADFRTSGLEVAIDKPTRDLVIQLEGDDTSPRSQATLGHEPSQSGTTPSTTAGEESQKQ